MNYYPFHIGDYASATRHLSWDEDLAYRRLLDVYYTTEKPLPGDLRQVCRLVLATTDAQREAVEVVLAEFFELTDDGWMSARADVEIATMRDKQQKQRDKANKRWAKPTQEHGNADAMPQHDDDDAVALDPDAVAMPPTPTPTPTPSKTKSAAAPDFVLPDWVPGDAWAGYIDMRKRIKKPMTPRAMDLAVAKLADLMRAGSDPKAVLDQSTMNSWQGLFEIKARGINTTTPKFDPVAFVNSVRKEASNVIDVTSH